MESVRESFSIIQAMIQKEEAEYYSHSPIDEDSSDSEASSELSVEPIDVDARYVTAEWFIKIMDICDYNRETAAIAMSCLDRFVSTESDLLQSRQQYNLAAMTALYIAVKTREPKALATHVVAQLSHGLHTQQDIEDMEIRLLQAIQWRVNPPTAMEFVRKFLELVPENAMDSTSREVVLDLVQCQVDQSISNFNCCSKRASHVAYASLLNAIETVYTDETILKHVAWLISLAANISTYSLGDLRDQLFESISHVNFSELLAKTKRAQQEQQLTTLSSCCESALSDVVEAITYYPVVRCDVVEAITYYPVVRCGGW